MRDIFASERGRPLQHPSAKSTACTSAVPLPGTATAGRCRSPGRRRWHGRGQLSRVARRLRTSSWYGSTNSFIEGSGLLQGGLVHVVHSVMIVAGGCCSWIALPAMMQDPSQFPRGKSHVSLPSPTARIPWRFGPGEFKNGARCAHEDADELRRRLPLDRH